MLSPTVLAEMKNIPPVILILLCWRHGWLLKCPLLENCFNYLRQYFSQNLPKEFSVFLHALIAQIIFVFAHSWVVYLEVSLLDEWEISVASLLTDGRCYEPRQKKTLNNPSPLCLCLFSFNIQTVQLSPPPILVLKRKRSAGMPLNPFSVQRQSPKVK